MKFAIFPFPNPRGILGIKRFYSGACAVAVDLRFLGETWKTK